ncbi:MAG: hypothetical protein MZU95_02275 [Desulfomicrobium escambiense]|nr:hypothetical protein [Desulfomicrobium escambiense]
MASLEGKLGRPRAKYVRIRRDGLPRQPVQPQQRRDLRQRARDHQPRRRRLVRRPSAPSSSKGTKVFSLVGKVVQHRPGGGARWAPPCARSSSTSAAASPTRRRSRPCRPAGPPAAASRSSSWTCHVDFDEARRKSARSWAPAA